MTYVSFAAVILVASALWVGAQTPKTKTAPTIPIEVREKYFKARSEYQAAQTVADQASKAAQEKNNVLQEQAKKIESLCGAEYAPILDKDGELACSDKPKIPETPKK